MKLRVGQRVVQMNGALPTATMPTAEPSPAVIGCVRSHSRNSVSARHWPRGESGHLAPRFEDQRVLGLAQLERRPDDAHRAPAAARSASAQMTPSTSEVAVWYSSASCSSFVRACTSSNNRAFSIAMTAWSAKVVTSSTSLVLNALTVLCTSPMTPIASPLRSKGTPSVVAVIASLRRFVPLISRIRASILYVDGAPFEHGPSRQCVRGDGGRIAFQEIDKIRRRAVRRDEAELTTVKLEDHRIVSST